MFQIRNTSIQNEMVNFLIMSSHKPFYHMPLYGFQNIYKPEFCSETTQNITHLPHTPTEMSLIERIIYKMRLKKREKRKRKAETARKTRDRHYAR